MLAASAITFLRMSKKSKASELKEKVGPKTQLTGKLATAKSPSARKNTVSALTPVSLAQVSASAADVLIINARASTKAKSKND